MVSRIPIIIGTQSKKPKENAKYL